MVAGNSAALKALEPIFHQDINGDGIIGLPAPVVPSEIASNALSLTASNDVFVFRPGFGASTIGDAAGAFSIELDGLASLTSHWAANLVEAQNGQPQHLFQFANGGHDTINPGNHDSLALLNVGVSHLLHASDFIIG